MHLDDRPPWIIRTYAGLGDAEATNARFRANLERGQRGLSVAFDLPTQNGYDSDHPMALGEVGGTGVAISHLGDMGRLMEGIPLGAANTSMTINATAPWVFALYAVLAGRQGVPPGELRGTTQNDLMKEFVARGAYAFDPATSLRLSTDLIAWAARHAPRWNPINACGYHYMESGASGALEVGLALGNALLVLDEVRRRVEPAEFPAVVARVSFFVGSGLELVPEVCKLRAYARLWPRLCKERHGIDGVAFRAGCQVRSLTLTAEQPELNIVRIAYEALPAVLSASARVGALQLPGFREALGLPDEVEQTLALRTQQVLMYETGVADHPDIFEGSRVVEGLTAELEEEARAVADRVLELGYEAAIPWAAARLTEALVAWHASVARGDRAVVGVNAFPEAIGLAEAAPSVARGQTGAEAVARQLARLAAWRARRDGSAVDSALDRFRLALARGEDTMSATLGLAEAGGTTGEWARAVEAASGRRYSVGLPGSGGAGGSGGVLGVAPSPVRYRVVLGKGGLDGHLNAVKLVAMACVEAGLEVVHGGLRQAPGDLAATAVQEDADVVGLSVLSGAHLHHARELLRSLAARGAGEVPVVVGGIIPPADRATLLEMGVRAVFTPEDGPVAPMVARLVELAAERRRRSRP
ncbi:MAG: cobalamin B12-binding domain-containing protein [Planctomycetes bacterium]|nr:cobalamin B12-binding domain-containing protein [Planctomycetota bacterium]